MKSSLIVSKNVMAMSNQIFLISAVHMLAYNGSSADISLTFLCDDDLHDICANVINSAESEYISANNVRIQVTGIVLYSSGDFITDVRTLNRTDNHRTALYVGVGNDHVVNAITCMSRAVGVPAVVYSTSHHRTTMYKEDVISIHPDHEGLARAIITLIGNQMIKSSFIICEDSLALDGLLEVFKEADQLYNSRTNDSHLVEVSVSSSDLDLRTLLVNVHDSGYRLVIVHSSPELFERLARVAADMSYFDAGYAWMITEGALAGVPLATDTMATEQYIPRGLLAVDGYETDMLEDLLTDLMEVIRNEISALLEKAALYNLTARYIAENFRTLLVGRKDIRSQLSRGIASNKLLFDEDGKRSHTQYRLLNLIEDAETSKSLWRTVGYIRGEDLDLNTVVWPSHSIFGPISNARAFLSIVTRPAEPFVYIRGPVEFRDSCVADTECLEVFTYEPSEINTIIEHFRAYRMSANPFKYPFKLHCCEGIVVDIIHALSVDMKFDFILYFQNDQNYGTNINGTWSGMMGDVISGAADLMAGAVSITSERVDSIAFTEAFYFSSFSMITGNNDRYTTLLAFMNPFHPYVWVLLVISATCVAVITSLFEWNSPFGLNPWGKRRKKNYTLGSAVTMVYSIWFGHTVKTKSPKSWPSKLIQNCWACLSIFVLAAYTANLAAFLAGNATLDTIYSILDTRLYTKRIGVVHTSAVEEHIRTINPNLQARFRNTYITNIDEGFVKLRNNVLDLYIDDTPLIEYALSRFDDNCSIKFASHSFGDNAYGFGMKKDSWLKKQLDPLVLDFVELGYVEDLKWRYMGKNRKCSNKFTNANNNDIQFRITHTAGLFVFLSSAIGLAIILLVLEHITYFVILPRLKKKPTDSIWKKRNVEYFSQRLYKSINSEKVEPPAKVLLSKVKKRKFEIQTRMRRQIRSFPSSMTSHELRNRRLNHILDMAYKNFYQTQNYHDSGIYTISDSVDEEIADMLTELQMVENQRRESSVFDLSSNIDGGYDNPVFDPDDVDIVIEEREGSGTCENCRFQLDDSACNGGVLEASVDNQRVIRGNNSVISRQKKLSKTSINRPSSMAEHSSTQSISDSENCANLRRKERRYETWPSPKARKRSIKRMQNNNVKSFSNADRENLTTNYRIVNELSTRKCRTCSSTSLDGLVRGRNTSVSLDLKDNRLKSNIRHHAMAATDRRRSMAFDQSAVEALSKEDLLVLWKRSEIELQTRLNRMLHQNNHLRRLVHIVEEYQQDGGHERTKPEENKDTSSDSDDESPVLMTTRL